MCRLKCPRIFFHYSTYTFFFSPVLLELRFVAGVADEGPERGEEAR